MAEERTYTMAEIAEMAGCGYTTVRRIVGDLGLEPVLTVRNGKKYFSAEDAEAIAHAYNPMADDGAPESAAACTMANGGEPAQDMANDGPPASAPAEPWRAVVDLLQADLEERRKTEAELRAQHAGEIAAMRERHAAEIADYRAQVAGLQAELTEVRQQLAQLVKDAQGLAHEAHALHAMDQEKRTLPPAQTVADDPAPAPATVRQAPAADRHAPRRRTFLDRLLGK